jgi:uncharacterized protein YndB with AHSA1/START domain
MIDVQKQVQAVTRTVGTRDADGTIHRVSVISQVYDTDIDDLWEAVTDPERIPRWFAPVTGELKEGGHYQIQGNASGTITRCEKPRGYAATWEFGGGVTWIEVRLSPVGADRTKFELEHYGPVPDEFWNQFGPTATGLGWDLALAGLGLHVADPATPVDHEAAEAWTLSPAGKAFLRTCADAWIAAYVADGGDPEAGRAMGDAGYGFFSGEAAPPEIH